MESERGRYIILGSIDGILAVLGIIIGLSSATLDPGVILKAALGGGIALCLTNGIGSYLAETAVEYGRLSDVEQALLQDLRHTKIEKLTKRNILIDSFLSGSSSFFGSLIPILPFVFASDGIAIYLSVALALASLVVLGLFSGRISRQSYITSIVRMVALGVIVVVVCSMLHLSP
ncbi:MAG TPA: VIT1/CCC1 transporter family protein [Methanocella sp.]|uniref:VIT1/CCC1 transporter family protein n=1 Tax=Methanocella sp. TaxID=2052833 RepID=UPI002C2469EE|nr:VIT1/CCC1 transporter family protein [Methanocella sp.]HTY90666.1 VIT1/CCC1 transporter family protein [Methanocella sp.]